MMEVLTIMTPSRFDNESVERRDVGDRARIYLQPIAAPSILGLFGFAGATFMVAANMAGWYGGPSSSFSLWPFALMFGGVAQFLAGMWAFKARDGVATAMHGMWGSFWIAYGVLNFLMMIGRVPTPGLFYPEMGYWFIVLAAITWMGMLGAFAASTSLVLVLGFLAGGSTLEAIARLTGTPGCQVAAGYLFIISAILAWYTASALMFEEAFGHPILKAGRRRTVQPAITMGTGEPGVIRGQ
jgi:uncharacterized protein